MSSLDIDSELGRCSDGIDACARAAAHAYKGLVDRGEPLTHDRLAAAVRCVVGLRDALVEGRRRGLDVEEDLRRVNSILSLAVSAEFPIVGIRHERVAATFNSLSRLADDIKGVRESVRVAAGSSP